MLSDDAEARALGPEAEGKWPKMKPKYNPEEDIYVQDALQKEKEEKQRRKDQIARIMKRADEI